MPSYCIVPSCSASSNNNNSKRIFHVLPKDLTMCVKWMEIVGLKDYADNLTKKRGSYRICSDHFEDTSYELRRTLLKTALPTLQLGDSNKSIKSIATETKTKPTTEHAPKTTSLANTGTALYDAYMQIEREVSGPIEIDEHTLRIEINRRSEGDFRPQVPRPSNSEEFLKFSRKFVSAKTLKLITCQTLMKNNGKRKLASKYKLFCLELYYHNPRAYDCLQQFMRLPPIQRLQHIYLNVSAGHISPRCLRLLELMVSKMNAKDRCCIVGVGSTMIKKHVYYDIRNDTLHGLHQIDDKQSKKPAKKAYVVVVKGLMSNWQLPVAFALFHESDVKTLAHWADTVTLMLMHTGLDVRAFISNQDDEDLRRLSELREISSDKNAFVLSNKTIYNIFDVRHLVKSLRDNLMTSDMLIPDEGVAIWDHILTFCNTEVEHQTNLNVELTHAHVDPDDNQRKNTKYAVQLFRKSTATAMKLFCRMELLDESALATVSLIDRVSDVFDLLNSDTLKHDTRHKRSFTSEESQENFLKEASKYFLGIKRVTELTDGVCIGDKIEPIVGFIVTIQSVRHLWKDLSEDGCSHLLTRSLTSLEFVEDFFREIHSQGEKRNNKRDQITTIEFNRAFNKSFITHMIKNSKLNSSKKLNSSLVKLKEYLEEEVEEREAESKALLIGNMNHKITLPEQNVIRFIAGYLMTKALEKHSFCNKLRQYMKPLIHSGSKTYVDYKYLENSSDVSKTLKLPVDFVLFVVKLEHEFVNFFQSELMPREVGAELLKAMEHLVIRPCPCFPLFQIKKLFVRLRIYNALKFINRQFKTSDAFEVNTYDL